MESRVDVTLTAKPTCEKSVQNMMPTDSPQLMMQKQLNALMRNICTVRFMLSANAARTPKTKADAISNGISIVV